MTAHSVACTESRELCGLLFEELRKRLPTLQRRETKRWCALFDAGRNRFAYVSHRRTSGSIEVWCAGDVDDLVAHGGIKVSPRHKIRGGWEVRFPARFVLKSARDLRGASTLLHEVSYSAS